MRISDLTSELAKSADLAQFPQDEKLVLITVNKTIEIPYLDLYDSVRYSWVLSPERASTADYILAVAHDLILDAFEAVTWLPATKANFPDISEEHGNWSNQKDRFGFHGKLALDDVRRRYQGKRLPDDHKSGQNPIRYVHY